MKRWNVVIGKPCPNLSESDVVRGCLAALHALGIIAWRNNTGAIAAEYKSKRRFVRYGAPGSADILGVLPGGRFLAVECKSRRGRLSASQRAFLEAIGAKGGLAIVTTDPAEMVKALSGEVQHDA